MNMVADQAWTGVGNLIAWRRETAWCRGDNATWKFSRDNMRNAGTDLGGVVSLLAPPGFILVSCWLLSIYWMLKLDAYARLFDDCWWLISGLLELYSLSIFRNAHPSFFLFISGSAHIGGFLSKTSWDPKDTLFRPCGWRQVSWYRRPFQLCWVGVSH